MFLRRERIQDALKENWKNKKIAFKIKSVMKSSPLHSHTLSAMKNTYLSNQ